MSSRQLEYESIFESEYNAYNTTILVSPNFIPGTLKNGGIWLSIQDRIRAMAINNDFWAIDFVGFIYQYYNNFDKYHIYFCIIVANNEVEVWKY